MSTQTEHESDRVNAIRHVVLNALQDGGGWSVPQLAARAKLAGFQTTETCISAVVRDLRKPKYGAHDVTGNRDADKVFRYALKKASS